MKYEMMRKHLSIALALIFITACSSTGNGTPESPIVTQAPTGPEAPAASATAEVPTAASGGSPSAGSGTCANKYYPVREGANWFYKSTGSPAGDYEFNDTITSVRNDGFTLTSKFGELTRTQEWACKSEGLVALQLGGGALRSQNIKLDVQTNTASGVTYPKEIATGNQWDYALDFTGKMDIAGNSGDAKGNQKVHFTALGTESVTVPVGTFDAMKIQVDTTLDITVTYQGLTVPVQFSSSYAYWYVQDLGWVKAGGTGSISGTSFSETIELVSYNFP